MKLIFYILFVLVFSLQTVTSQTQLGSTLNGENDGDYFGRDVSLSSDGTIMAVGAINNDGNGTAVGHVRVYKFNDGSWQQIGNDIDSNQNDENDFGHSVSLSSDGTILAIGDRNYNSENGRRSGLVKIYQYSNNSWSQIGNDIIGLSQDSNFGFDVSLSSDGSIVASGDIGNNELSGTIRVFEFSNNGWTQIGSTIFGSYVGERLGYSLDLSSDGTTLAAAAPYQNEKLGEVKVFQFSTDPTSNSENYTWNQLGDDINGEEIGDEFGNKIQLNSDGTILAVGAPYNKATYNDNPPRAGHVRVYEFSQNSWSQIGSDIDAEDSQDEFGRGIGLSSNGRTVAIGGTQYHGNGKGIVRVYNWNGSDWEKFGNTINSDNISNGSTDFFGEEVSLSSDGTIVAAGAKAGNYVKVYNLDLDQTRPTITITSGEITDGQISNDNTLSLTFTTNEDTSNFTIDDVTVVGGVLSGFESSSGSVYTSKLIPTEDGEITVDVNENTFTDASGNGNLASEQFNWIYDSTGPTMVISSNSSSSTNTISTVAGGNGRGSALNQLHSADGIFVDSSKNIFIADTQNHRIVKWEPGASEGVVVAGGNGKGDALNQLYEPKDIFIDSSGNMIISDGQNHRVLKWEPGASEGVVIAGGNGQGDALNQFFIADGIDFDSSGNLYVADQNNNRVMKWEPGASEGTVVAGGNGVGNALNQLHAPTNVAVDLNENIYIASHNNKRITKWSSGASEGVVYASGGFFNDVFLDSNDDVYIADGDNHRILKWPENASEGIVIAGGNNQDYIILPMSIYIDSSSNLYILDNYNEKIQKVNIDDNCTLSLTFTSNEPTSNFNIDDISVTGGTLSDFNSLSSTVYTATFTPNTSQISSIIVDGNTFTDELGNINSVSNLFEWSCENNIPTAIAQSVDAIEQVNKTIELTGSDPRDAILNYIIVSLPTSGTLTSNGSEIKSDELPKTINSSNVVYKAISETASEDSFDFKVSNGYKESIPSKVSINITLKSIITITSEKSEIFEHENTIVTASISNQHSEDIHISLNFDGEATFSKDYEVNFETLGNISTVAGGNGTGNALNQLKSTSNINRGVGDVQVDSSGNVYIADSGNYRVMKWEPGSSEGTAVVFAPDTSSSFIGANISIHVDSSGNIYVAEMFNHRVTKWVQGASEGVIVAGGNGSGSSYNQLNRPFGVFVDSNENVYVSDGHNHRVMKWEPGASEGILVAGGNNAGSNLNQLKYPHKLNVHSSGDIYIADESNHRIVKWSPGATEGVIVAGGNPSGDQNDLSRVKLPRGLYVTDQREIYIAETLNNRITLWKEGDKKGRLISSGKENSPFNAPTGVFVDNLNNIYVAEDQNARVQKILFYPEIIIKKGSLSNTIEISAIEELPENIEENEDININSSTKSIYHKFSSSDPTKITIKNNTLEFIKKDNPFINLSNSSTSWGDYDRDGDMDLAVMGQSNSVGAVTEIYENKEGSFVSTNQAFNKVYDGDLSWVDINKDGWLDLVVSGYNQVAKTDIYINDNGQTFNKSNDDWGIPNAYASTMSWGDLDNDGDIDLAFVGIDEQENGFSYLYLRVDNENKFIVQDLSYFSGGGFKYGDLEIADFDQDSDNDLIFTGERINGELRSQIKLNSFISPLDAKYDSIPLVYSRDIEENIPYALKNASITTYFNQSKRELSYIIMGRNSNGDLKTLIRSVGEINREENTPLLQLEDGDVSVGDINNDGFNDFLYTGEDAEGSPITKLFYTNSKGFYESNYGFENLRESTVDFIDYDMDGDLDIFLTGLSDDGSKTVLYEVNLNSKINTPPSMVENINASDLGYGNIRLDWDHSSDDFSNTVGYNIRIGTTPGGSELTNTLSDLETGSRLISSPPPILTNEFQTNLFPGNYYISIQSIDPGVKASKFSEEIYLQLVYDWKLVNQGGIVDRYISGKKDPIILLADLDGDNDLDLLNGSRGEDNEYQLNATGSLIGHKYDAQEKRMIRIDRERKTVGSLSNFNINFISDIKVGLINSDEYVDVIINRYESDGSNALYVHFGKAPLNGGSSNLNEQTLVYDQIRVGDGLYDGKIKIADINNDGQIEIIQIGNSNDNQTSGIPQLFVYSYLKDSNSFEKKDYSEQIANLSNSSFDLGDYDNDQDIDLVITGFDQSNGLKTFLYKNITESGEDFNIQVDNENLVATRDGSIDFFDFDSDGDLDILITGTGINGDIFEIYVNKLNEELDWARLNSVDLPGLRKSKIEYGDFNGDGYSDLLYTGVQSGSGKISELREYESSSGNYIESNFDIGEIVDADVKFGDIDGDGIPDSKDLCPNMAGTEKTGGCPEMNKEEKETLEYAGDNVEFQFGKSTLLPESYDVLDQVIAILNRYPDFQLEITGHTDDVGRKENNMLLSIDRAQACADYIKARGIDDSRLTIIGKGELNPLDSNKTDAGRRKNRRVEFNVLGQ